MRSDVVKRHMKVHEKRNEDHPRRKRKLEDDDDKLIIKRKCNEIDDDELEKDMIKDNEEYIYKLALGEKVYKILCDGKVKQVSLSLERKEALNIYRRNKLNE